MKEAKTNWITIPEEKIHLHTPVDNPSPQKAVENTEFTVKNKILWGIGFVILIGVTLGLLAPKEMSSLLQGNLFESPSASDNSTTPEAAGTNAFGLQPMNPISLLPAKTADNATSDSEAVASDPETVPVDTSSQNQTVVQAETTPVDIQVDPITPASPDVANATPESKISPPNEGGGKEPGEEGVNPSAVNSNDSAALIAQLQEQLQNLQNGTHPAASSTGASTGSSTGPSTGTPIPDFAQTTQNLGQNAGSMQPLYRTNPYRVTVQPQTLLQQYSTGAYRLLPPAAGTSANQSIYSANLLNAQGTPNSGPSESLFIGFAVTFLGLVGWKSLRVMMA